MGLGKTTLFAMLKKYSSSTVSRSAQPFMDLAGQWNKSVQKAVTAVETTNPSIFSQGTEELRSLWTTAPIELVKSKITKIIKPTNEELKELVKTQGLDEGNLLKVTGKLAWHGKRECSYITENNSLFLKYLSEKFPKSKTSQTNTKVQKLMLYLQDINHAKFQDKEAFINQFLADIEEVEALVAKDGSLLYGENAHALYTKKAILQAKYNEPERYQDLMNLIKLHQKGIIPKHNVELFFPQGQLHSTVKTDLTRLIQGKSYYPQFSEFIEKDIERLELGEAFSVGQKMYVKLEKGYKQLKMNKATYEKLFPPIERYSISQGDAGNCGKIAALNAMTKNPKTRIMLYDMFEETPSGVKVSIPNKGYAKEFNLDDLTCLNQQGSLQGSLGHKMLEYTYDISHTKSIQVTNGDYSLMVQDLTGIQPFSRSDNIPMISNIWGTKDCIGYSICGTHDIDKGFWDSHWLSCINLEDKMYQNPWSCMDEFRYYQDIPSIAHLTK